MNGVDPTAQTPSAAEARSNHSRDGSYWSQNLAEAHRMATVRLRSWLAEQSSSAPPERTHSSVVAETWGLADDALIDQLRCSRKTLATGMRRHDGLLENNQPFNHTT